MSKRKNGEGSWGTKTFKGVTYQYFRDSDGKYTYAKTIKELKAKLKEKSENSPGNAKNTFQDYSLKYINTYLKPTVSRKTYDSYEMFVTKTLDPYAVTHMQMSSITSINWKELISELTLSYSYSTISIIWHIVKQVVKYAEINNDIAPNTLYGIKLPKKTACGVKTKQVPFISEEDMNILWDESFKKTPNGKPLYQDGALIIDLIMYTGLRISEACSLKLKDINLDTNELTVNSTLSRVIDRDKKGNAIKKDNGAIKQVFLDKSPKSASSNRTIPLSNRALQVINIILEKYPNKKPDDYFFVTRNGSHYSIEGVSNTLKILQHNSNCSRKDYSPHSLRHGFGSILISKGADIKLVSELLGHSDIKFTYNIYIGIYDKDKRKAINLLD